MAQPPGSATRGIGIGDVASRPGDLGGTDLGRHGGPMSRRPLPVLTRRWMTIALVALMIVAVVVAISR